MPKRSSKKKRPHDANQLAKAVVDEAVGEAVDDVDEGTPDDEGKNPAAVAQGAPCHWPNAEAILSRRR